MLDNYEQINQIPILNILDKLNIWYQKISDIYSILENWKPTDGWRVNIKGNYINDFSWKGRSVWNPFNFVRAHLWITNKETFDWFRDRFSISTGLIKKAKIKKTKTKQTKLPQYKGDR